MHIFSGWSLTDRVALRMLKWVSASSERSVCFICKNAGSGGGGGGGTVSLTEVII